MLTLRSLRSLRLNPLVSVGSTPNTCAIGVRQLPLFSDSTARHIRAVRSPYSLRCIVLLLAIGATRANAQICAGDGSFAAGAIHLGASAALGDDFQSYGVAAGLGAAGGPWLIGNAAIQQYDQADDDS